MVQPPFASTWDQQVNSVLNNLSLLKPNDLLEEIKAGLFTEALFLVMSSTAISVSIEDKGLASRETYVSAVAGI